MKFIDSVQQILDTVETEDMAASKSMAAKVAVVQGLMTFPPVAQMAIKTLSNPDFKMSEVSQIINRDPALAIKILRLANSAFFSRGNTVESIDKAMVRLGRTNVTEAIWAVAAMGLFPDNKGYGKEVRDHCASTAAITGELVSDLIPAQKEGAFVCGLMHDIGKLLLISTDEQLYNKASPQQLFEPESSIFIERQQLGYDHAVLAGQVLWHWNFPEPIPQIVAWHHRPDLALKEKEIGPLTAMIKIASQIDRQISYNLTGLNDFISELLETKHCQFVSISEDYLLEKWSRFVELRSSSLSIFV